MRNRQQQQLVAVDLGPFLQQWDRLLAVGRVVIDERNLLTLELVHAAFLLADVLDQDVGSGPVRAAEREIPAEDRAIHRVGPAVTCSDDRDLVDKRFVGDRERDAGRQRVECSRAGRPLAFEPLVTLDAAGGVIGVVALFERDLDPVDTAVARVHQFQVVDVTVGKRDAVRGVGAGAIHHHREELLLRLGKCRRGRADRGYRGQRSDRRQELRFGLLSHLHFLL